MKRREQFEQQGYLIARNVFTSDEVERLRKSAYTYRDEQEKLGLVKQVKQAASVKGDLLSKDGLGWVIYDPRIVAIATDLLGDTPVYFSDSTYQIGTGTRGFHRDNIDRYQFGQGADWDGNYPLIRFGIYLQDHDTYSGGIRFKTGSHNAVDGADVFADTRAGDIVVWNMRTLHSGNARRLKVLTKVPLHIGLENRLPDFLFREQQGERVSLFFSYGLEGKHLDRYLENHIQKRADMQENVRLSNYSPETLKKAEKGKIKVLDVKKMVG
ncbi:phytanoyl-CoA dioxygenase family protein [Spirosoma sp. BT702]|uniref:Phytanoyl-CoA dioxygenase family protein n=1 Tax=Spirosoma profusum TaxID=2771354 RepID=A0A926XSZ9_9BACT|nr:phytanoyl-CoA dioxygenase family protein [Spirosoma profusum]MBD2699322.1 phytanoyl-CoA dioxygenase family protein [Spirosoma profusum]